MADQMLALVSSKLPDEREVAWVLAQAQAQTQTQKQAHAMYVEAKFQESMTKIKRLMFDEDPEDALAKIDVVHGVCGAQWTHIGMAYRCMTCGLDEHCSICVPCFNNGNHNDHAYLVINQSSGCCDCGDATTMKREGFCPNHGSEEIKPIEDKVADRMKPVMEALFKCWKSNLHAINISGSEESKKYPNELTRAVVMMLCHFCNHSDSLVRFISTNMMYVPGLLELLVNSERFLKKSVVKIIHDLLLKLLGDNSLRYEFALEFIKYYPNAIKEIIKKGRDKNYSEHFPMLSKFTSQIFTIPTITCDLVENDNLFGILFECVQEIFDASVGSDGRRLEVKTWLKFHGITTHVLENIRVVISHGKALQHMFTEQGDLIRAWLRLLSFVQGMYPLKQTSGPYEEEDFSDQRLLLSYHIANINSVLGGGGLKVPIRIDDDDDKHAPDVGCLQVPDFAPLLTYECLSAIKYWYDATHGLTESRSSILSFSMWPDIKYDVGSEEISVHLPLHQFLSVVLRNVTRFLVHSDGVFGHLFGDYHPYGASALIMEHPLRAMVFCAQKRVGMWNVDDETALLSFDWYSNISSLHGLQSDLYLLQFCAAFAPSDCYIKRISERFGLADYLSRNLQNPSEYELALVKEMLTLIIHILQERGYCGLTSSESLKRDLICILANKDSTYNELLEQLPIELSKHQHQHHFKEILETIAIYSSPCDNNQGKYSLQSTFWKELDWYHPCWGSKNSQAAERYKRLCVSPLLCIQQLPRWTNICPPLKEISKIATCRPLLQIIRAVMFSANNDSSGSYDDILSTTLHLFSLVLDICLEDMESRMRLLAFSNEEMEERSENGDVGHNLLSLVVKSKMMHKSREKLDKSGHFDISALIEYLLEKYTRIDFSCTSKIRQLVSEFSSHVASDSDESKAKAKERRASIMAKMKAEQSKFLSNIDSAELDDSESEPKESLHDLCSLCTESNPEEPVIFLILLQKSKVLSLMKEHSSWTASSIYEAGTYISSCGHSMHQRCIEEYLTKLRNSDVNFEREGSDKVQFLCPMCRHLANFVIPRDFVNFEKRYVNIINEEIKSLNLPEAVNILCSTSARVIDLQSHISSLQTPILQSMSRLVSKMHFQQNANLCPSLILWEAITYSLKSMEIASRCGSLSLNALFREVESSTGFVLFLLMENVRKLETQDDHVYLRYSGFRLLSMSLRIGFSLETLNYRIDEREVQYWNRAGDPILTRDPFSSLMWILFYFPSSSINCDETFMSLLHMLYAVNLAQSLIMYCAIREFNMGDCEYFLINHICHAMRIYGFARQSFVPNYDESSSDMVDVIRKLSFPYLRRCGLLWKLLTSPKLVPYTESDQVMHTVGSDVTELEGVQELETMFKIPSVDEILKDKYFQDLVMPWIHHFGKEFEARRFQDIFYLTPALPFKLINLPSDYRFLLERYSSELCPECSLPIVEPALCLFCEKLCEAEEDDPCCSANKCKNHVKGCGAGMGIFLLIETTKIRLQRFKVSAPWPSPYLDENGSEGVAWRTDVPLFLNKERYAALANMVASHRIDWYSDVLPTDSDFEDENGSDENDYDMELMGSDDDDDLDSPESE